MESKGHLYECMGIMPAAGAKLRGASNLLFLFVWFTMFPLLVVFGLSTSCAVYCRLCTEIIDLSPESDGCGSKVSHNRSNGKSVARKTRAIAPTESLWAERLAQSLHRKVCGLKDSHNRSNEMVLARKTRAIAPPESLWLEKTRAIGRTGLFWSEKLAQSAATEVFRSVVRRRQSANLWVIHSLRLSDQKCLDEGQPSAFARRICR